MVGDLVKFPHGIDKVCDLPYVEGWGICASFAASATLFPVPVEALEPILLTSEILEKNFPEPTDGLTWFPEEGGFNCHTYELKCGINAFGLFKYVHQLQNALRLCGINLEIKI